MRHRLNIAAAIFIPALIVAGLASIPAMFAASINGWVGIAVGFGVTWGSGVFIAVLAWRDAIPVRRLLNNVRPQGDDIVLSGDIWMPTDPETLDGISKLLDMNPELAEQMKREHQERQTGTEESNR